MMIMMTMPNYDDDDDKVEYDDDDDYKVHYDDDDDDLSEARPKIKPGGKHNFIMMMMMTMLNMILIMTMDEEYDNFR